MIKEEINFIEKTKKQDRKELENLSVEEIVKKTLENGKIDIREYEVEIAVILKKYNLEIKMNTEKRKNSLIQIVLNQINPNNNLEIDGIIGEKSKKAILNFQKNFNKNNLDKLNENGVLDKKTEKAIFNYFRNFENNLLEATNYIEDNKKTKNKNQEADEQFKKILKQKAKEDGFDYDNFIKENNITFENNNEEDNFYRIIKEKSKEDGFNYNNFLKENNITNEDVEKYNKNSNSENDDYSLDIVEKESEIYYPYTNNQDNIYSQDLINQASVNINKNNNINPQIPNISQNISNNFIGQNINQKISNNNFNPNDYYQNGLRIQKSGNNLTISDGKGATTSISGPGTVCMNGKCYSN